MKFVMRDSVVEFAEDERGFAEAVRATEEINHRAQIVDVWILVSTDGEKWKRWEKFDSGRINSVRLPSAQYLLEAARRARSRFPAVRYAKSQKRAFVDT